MRMPTIKSLKSESSLGWDEVRFQAKPLGSMTSAWSEHGQRWYESWALELA